MVLGVGGWVGRVASKATLLRDLSWRLIEVGRPFGWCIKPLTMGIVSVRICKGVLDSNINIQTVLTFWAYFNLTLTTLLV